MKRIVICADGTWNRPERIGQNDCATHVLRFARGIAPHDANGVKQVVFYDWGIGSYHDKLSGGGFGEGLEKNVMDGYRFLVHNYDPGDEIYLFGFSRGAYTIRSLCGMLNNCSILRGELGGLVEEAFDLYKTKKYSPSCAHSYEWRENYAVQQEVKIKFVGAWDTVGALGLPITIFGLIKNKHLFYDRKLGSNMTVVRHALALDELRDDFKPTMWDPKPGVDLKQVWFAGVHADIGGGYRPDSNATLLADIPLMWMLREAEQHDLTFEPYMKSIQLNPCAKQHNEYKGMFKLLGAFKRYIDSETVMPTTVHSSVQDRYNGMNYKSRPIEEYIAKNGHWPPIEP
jgi:uncharacterized protein (DUF2235 family)